MRHQNHSGPSCPLQNCDTNYWVSPLWVGDRSTPRNVLLIPDVLSPACSSNPAGLVGKPISLRASASSPFFFRLWKPYHKAPYQIYLFQDAAGSFGCPGTAYSLSGDFILLVLWSLCIIISLKDKDSCLSSDVLRLPYLGISGQCSDIWPA